MQKVTYEEVPSYIILYVENEGEEWRVVSGRDFQETQDMFEKGYFYDFRGMGNPKKVKFFKKAIFRQVSNDEKEQQKWLKVLEENLENL